MFDIKRESNSQMDLSIVIPAFNECEKIAVDIQVAYNFLAKNGISGEIIVVDDGSTDETARVAQIAGDVEVGDEVSFEVIRYEQNRGKGYAVRTGIAKTRGEYVMFVDCGGCIPYGNVLVGIDILKNHHADIQIAHASRRMQESKIHRGQALHRRICSWAFRQMMVHVMGLSDEFTDTQCGFKIYKGDAARKIYAECITDGFMFDVEVILRAQQQGYAIEEFPIDWTCDPDSRLSVTKNFWEIMSELIKIRRVLKNKTK